MAGRYKPYPGYKDSGVQWLGEIPRHWGLTRIKFITQCLDGARIPLNSQQRGDMQGDIPYWGANSVVDHVNSYLFDEDLILLGEDGAPFFDKTKEVAFNVSGKIWPNNHVHVLRPNKKIINNRFLRHAINCADFHLYISGSTRDKLNQSDMNQIYVRNCGAEEQETIANFLDHETAKIDTLIEKQQQLIQLLKEKRQAVISHAVTKGLNLNAMMKDSGVEWLGEVPVGWEVKRVRYAFQVDNNLRTPIDRQSRMDIAGEYPYYGPTGILSFINKFNIEGEYFLLGEDGDHFLKFNEKSMTIKVHGRFSVNNHAHLLKGKGNCLTRWGCLYFECLDLFPWLIKQGIGRYKLRKEVLIDIPILVPPESEQKSILEEIERKKNKFELVENEVRAAITLLKERRSALISAAVTGKIDVRSWQAPKENHNNREVAA